MLLIILIYCFSLFLMNRRPPRSTRLTHSFPTRRSSDLQLGGASQLACHTRAVAPGATPTAFAHRAQGRLALATKRLSSRHSLPGPIALAAWESAGCWGSDACGWPGCKRHQIGRAHV